VSPWFEVSGAKARISSYHIADNGTAAMEDKGDVGFIATIREVGPVMILLAMAAPKVF
jgi:hypothetical protein